MTLDPAVLARRWKRIVRLGDVLLEEYAWAHSFAYGPSSRSIASTRAPSTPNNPTERTALDGRRSDARHALRLTARRLIAVAKTLDATLTALEATLGKVEAPQAGGHAALSRVEREALHAARARREARGEGWGDG